MADRETAVRRETSVRETLKKLVRFHEKHAPYLPIYEVRNALYELWDAACAAQKGTGNARLLRKHHRRCADEIDHGGMCVDCRGNVLEEPRG